MIIELMLQIGTITSKLNELLDIKMVTSKQQKTCIGQSVINIIKFNNERNIQAALFEIGRLKFLIFHLELLRSSKPKLFSFFKKILLSDKSNFDKYFGTRFEIAIAAALAEKSIDFDKTEPPLPDFIINNEKVFIECTSKHLGQINQKFSFTKQLKMVMNGKNSKEYANISTALFIDITNIYYYLPNSARYNIRDFILQEIPELITSYKFGSFLFHVYIQDETQTNFEQSYVRIDSVKINDTLCGFLNSNFPLGNSKINNYFISNNV
jgi:hypothetical protein